MALFPTHVLTTHFFSGPQSPTLIYLAAFAGSVCDPDRDMQLDSHHNVLGFHFKMPLKLHLRVID